MTNKKTTKQQLVASIVLLFMCFSMLLGTTFAWFTDSATSAGNKIVAGTLDVQLWMYDESKSDYVNIGDSATPIFGEASGLAQNNAKDTLWEPGKTQVVYLKIVNNGSLDLKYNVAINVRDTADDKNLYEVLEYAIDADAKATDAKLPVWDGGKKVIVGNNVDTTNVELPAKEDGSNAHEHFFALSVHMLEEAGNEYQGGYVEFDIKVAATQLASEEDSFDNTYDEDAFYYDVRVETAEELYSAVSNAKANTTIAVDGNIKLTKALSKDGLESITFVAWDDEATIDQATYNMYFSNATVTFDGLTLTHGEKAYGDGGQTSTAFAVWNAKEVNYVDCVFNRSVGTIHATTHNFVGCTFNGVENPGNTKSEYPLYICDGQNYNVVDCVFNCTNRGAILFYNDGGSGTDTLNISNTTFLGDIIADKTAVEIHNNSKTQVYNVNISNVIVGDGIINGLYRIKPANVGTVNMNVDGVKEVATASSAAALTNAISNAQPGDTVYLNTDVNVGATQFKLEKDVTLDLNGQELTTQNNWGGMTISNGGSIKNGVINHPGNTAAIKVSGNAGAIENVTINITPTQGKTKTGIQVYNGKYVESIKNVTISGATQGIEVAKGSRVDLIENVTVNAVADGAQKGTALLVNAASVGKAVNCSFTGDYGVRMMLNGEFHVTLELENCVVNGGEAALIAHDEAGISNVTNCSLSLDYDDDTVFNGDFIWNFEDECIGVVKLNGVR